MDVHNFAERLRAQREAAERLISRRSAEQKPPSAPDPGKRSGMAATSAAASVAGLSSKTMDTVGPSPRPSMGQEGRDASATTENMVGVSQPPHGPHGAESPREEEAFFTRAPQTADMPPTPDVGPHYPPAAPQGPEAGMAHGPAAMESPQHGVEPHPAGGAHAVEEGGYLAPEPAIQPGPATHEPGAELLEQPAEGVPPHGPSTAHAGHDAAAYGDVYNELEQLDERPRKGSVALLIVAFVLIAGLAAAAVFFLFGKRGSEGGASATKNVPVINAPDKPVKMKPKGDVPAKQATPARRKLIYDRIIDEDAAGTKPVQPPAAPPPAVQPAPAPQDNATPLPPPLPPPPSLGDDQGNGKAVPDVPASEDKGGETRTAETEPTTVAPAGGGVEESTPTRPKADTTEAITAGAGELSSAAKAFASSAKPSATARSTADEASKRVAEATGIAMPSGNGGTAEEKPAAREKVGAAPPRATAPSAASSAGNKKGEPKARKRARSVARAVARPSRKKGEVAKAPSARKVATPRPRVARKPARKASESRLAARGPIPLPGAVPLTSSLPSAVRPATTGSVAKRADDTVRAFAPTPARPPVSGRKRTNFKQVKVLGAPSRSAIPLVKPAPQPRRMASIDRAPRAAAPLAQTTSRRGGTASAGGYKVQLAAFRSRQDALRAWQRIRARHGRILGGLQPIITTKQLGDAGTFYRLSIGPLPSRQQAARLCQQLIARGEPDCLIRK